MASQWAIQDQNRVPALLLHTGTAGTAETVRATAQASGAANVHTTGGTVNISGAAPAFSDLTLGNIVSGNASNTNGSSTEVIAAQGVGTKTYLEAVTVTNVGTVASYCELKSGTVVMWTFPVPGSGGVTHNFGLTPLPPNAANLAWNFDMGTAITTTYCSMVGFKSTT